MAGKARKREQDDATTRELFVRSVELDVDDDHPLPAGHPFDLPAIRTLGERAFTAPVTVFVGENGTGKSTLLEAIAVALGLNAEGGSKHLRFATRESHSRLHERLRVVRGRRRPRDAFFLRAESFYNVATAIDEVGGQAGAYGGGSLHERSHGESFLDLFVHRFFGDGIYLLDEPEAALSPQRQLALLARMHQLVQDGSQLIVATHSPLLLAYPGADVWQFNGAGIARVAATETDHWRVTRRFLADPDAVLRELLA